MKQIKLKDDITKIRDMYYDEVNLKRVFPSLMDGCKDVNRAIMLSMKDLTKGTNKLVKATNLEGYVTSNYHLHKETAAYFAAVNMSEGRLPLIKVNSQNKTGTARNKDTGDYVWAKYIDFSLTEFGQDFVRDTLVSPTEYNYDRTIIKPQYFTSLFPNLLFNGYTNIGEGISSKLLPLNPREVFEAMIFVIKNMLQNNFEIKTEDLMKIIKGVDIGHNRFAYMNSESLRSLIEDGDFKVTVRCPVEMTPNYFEVKEVPFGSSLKAIQVRLNDLVKKNQLETFIISEIRMIDAKYLRVYYAPRQYRTEEEVLAEVYEKTQLLRSYKCEYVGTVPKNYNNQVTEPKLHISGIKTILKQHIIFGFRTRIAQIEEEIKRLNEQFMINKILEKLTREETKVWFKELIYDEDNKEKTLQLGNERIKEMKVGNLTIEGGLTKDEVDIIFEERGNEILPKLNKRRKILKDLEAYLPQLEYLTAQKQQEPVLKFLIDTLTKWKNKPECARQTKILYKNVDEDIKADFIEVERQLLEINREEYPASILVYEDCTLERTNGCKTTNRTAIKEIYDVNIKDNIYILSDNFRTKVNAKKISLSRKSVTEYTMDNGYQGIIVVGENDLDKQFILVTTYGRVLKVLGTTFQQNNKKVKGFAFMEGEKLLQYHVIDKETENLAVEVLTNQGVKRKRIDELGISKGFNSYAMFSAKLANVIDSRIVDANDTIVTIYSDEVEVFEVDPSKLYKRNVSNEYKLGIKDIKFYPSNRAYYYEDKRINSKLLFDEYNINAKFSDKIIAYGEDEFNVLNLIDLFGKTKSINNILDNLENYRHLQSSNYKEYEA